jgi:hypothetical protein
VAADPFGERGQACGRERGCSRAAPGAPPGRTEIAKYDDASPIKLLTEFDDAGFNRVFLASVQKMMRPAKR